MDEGKEKGEGAAATNTIEDNTFEALERDFQEVRDKNLKTVLWRGYYLWLKWLVPFIILCLTLYIIAIVY